MIHLSEFEQTVREFAVKYDLDLTDASLFEQTVRAVAESLIENKYQLSLATILFVDLVKDLDKALLRTLHSDATLRRVYKAI